MKLFSTLTNTNKERALHMAEHIVLDGLLENGVQGTPENAEEQEQFEEAQKALEHAKTLATTDEQAEYLFENSTTGELILEKAYQVASTAFYIEEDEMAFHLKEMDEHFSNKEPGEEKEETLDEKEFASLITTAPPKDTRHLN